MRVDGPNGFFREFKGDKDDPSVEIKVTPTKRNPKKQGLENKLEVRSSFLGPVKTGLEFLDNVRGIPLPAIFNQENEQNVQVVDAGPSSGWYDFTIKDAGGSQFQRHFAGRVETGEWSISDPAMG